jgi:hypothetical protein
MSYIVSRKHCVPTAIARKFDSLQRHAVIATARIIREQPVARRNKRITFMATSNDADRHPVTSQTVRFGS